MTNESKVARYDPNLTQIVYHSDTHTHYVAEMLERHNGTYVTHADYKALEDECERLRARVGELPAPQRHVPNEGAGEFNYVEGWNDCLSSISVKEKVS